MKRNLFKTVIAIFNIVLLTVLLCFYVNSDIVAMSVCIIIIIGVDVIALCIFLNSLFEIEIEYCHKHLSDCYTTEVIPLKMKDVKMKEYLIQTTNYKAMLNMDGGIDIFIQSKNEDTDFFYETIDLTDFRKFYKIK